MPLVSFLPHPLYSHHLLPSNRKAICSLLALPKLFWRSVWGICPFLVRMAAVGQLAPNRGLSFSYHFLALCALERLLNAYTEYMLKYSWMYLERFCLNLLSENRTEETSRQTWHAKAWREIYNKQLIAIDHFALGYLKTSLKTCLNIKGEASPHC